MAHHLTLLAPLALALLLLGGCGARGTPTPTHNETTLPAAAAQAALAAAESYRWQTTFAIQAGNDSEATAFVEGERSHTSDAERVLISERAGGDPQAGWVRVGPSLWLANADGSWVPLPASSAQEAIRRLQFLDPATVWATLAAGPAPTARLVGTEQMEGRDVAHYRWESEHTPAFLAAEEITPTQPIQFDAWLDSTSQAPLKTAMRLTGRNAKNEQGTIALDIAVRALGTALTITPPEGAASLPGASSERITEALADGTTLPLAPGAQPTLPETVADEIATLVQTFALLGQEPGIALQLYSTSDEIAALEAFFERELPAAGWTVDQRVPGQYTDDALTLLASDSAHNAQIIMIPLAGGTLVITTVQ